MALGQNGLHASAPEWYARFIQIITDPTVAYLLLLAGLYGLFFELLHPGFIAPGLFGLLSLLIALYAFQFLPISYTGLLLILIGLLFLIGEVLVPCYGSLGFIGTVAFILGSILLMGTDNAGAQIAWSAIFAMAVINILVLVFLFGMAIRARRRPLQHGNLLMIGATGYTLGEVNPDGQAMIRGEIWSIHAKSPIDAKKLVRVIAIEGLRLEVEEII